MFAYYTILGDPPACAAAQAVSGVPPAITAQHRAVLTQDPKFTKLDELRRAIT